MQTVQARYINNVLQSCMHLLFSATLTGRTSNITAGGSQYVICAKYKIYKTFNQQSQPRGYSSGNYTSHLLNIILTIISCPLPPCLVHGMLWHWLDLHSEWQCISYFYISNVLGVDLRPRYPVYDQCVEAVQERQISHNSPWLHVKSQDGEDPAHWTWKTKQNGGM